MGVRDIFQVMQARRSCRQFKPDPRPEFEMVMVRLAGETAPYASGGPRREVIGPIPGKTIASACYNQRCVHQAPCAWIMCGKDRHTMLRSGHAKYIFDCAATCMLMDLMAVSLGMGTCWIGHFDPDMVRKACSIDDDLVPTIILLAGVRNDG